MYWWEYMMRLYRYIMHTWHSILANQERFKSTKGTIKWDKSSKIWGSGLDMISLTERNVGVTQIERHLKKASLAQTLMGKWGVNSGVGMRLSVPHNGEGAGLYPSFVLLVLFLISSTHEKNLQEVLAAEVVLTKMKHHLDIDTYSHH